MLFHKLHFHVNVSEMEGKVCGYVKVYYLSLLLPYSLILPATPATHKASNFSRLFSELKFP